MLNKLFVAGAVAVAVVYFGDPYSPENRGRLPWLPPDIPESALVELRDGSATFFEGIELEGAYQAVVEHELTHEIFAFFGSLRERAWEIFLELRAEDGSLIARANG